MRVCPEILSNCFSASDDFGGRDDLPDVPRRVFGDVKQQSENSRRKFLPSDQSFGE